MSHYCAYCGTLVLDDGDTFCGNCGHPLTRSTSAGQASGAGTPAPYPSTPSAGASGGVLGVPQSLAPTVIVGPSTAAPVPGVGAPPPPPPSMGTAAQVFANSGTSATAAAPASGPSGGHKAYAGYAAPASGARAAPAMPPMPGVPAPPPGGFPPPLAPASQRAYAGAPAPQAGEPLASFWLAALAVAGAALFAILGLLLWLLPTHFVVWYWSWAVVSAFWLAAVILPRTRTLLACLQVTGWNVLLFADSEIVFALLFPGFIVRRLQDEWQALHPHHVLTKAEAPAVLGQLFVQALGRVIVVVAIASVLGIACALLLAHWPRARALPRPRGFARSVGLPLLVVAGAVLLYFAILVPLFARASQTGAGLGLAVAWGYLVPLAASIAFPVVAVWLMRRALRQAASRAMPPAAGRG